MLFRQCSAGQDVSKKEKVYKRKLYIFKTVQHGSSEIEKRDESAMKKMKRRTQRNILLGICVLAVFLLIVLLIRGIGRLTAGHADTSEGIGYIESAESEDITVIEEKISRLEEQDGKDSGERSLKERFSQAVVLGDASALGFTEYNILNASSIAAEAGVHLDQSDSLIQKTKALSPRIIFLSLGSADVNAANGDIAQFTELYGEFLETLQAEIPDAHIFVNSIFPVQEKAYKDYPAFEQIGEYNAALEQLCDSQRVGYIDNTGIVEDQYYEEDGIHFNQSFFSVWAENMAEVAVL